MSASPCDIHAELSKQKTTADTTHFLTLLSKLAIESDVRMEHDATTPTLALGRRHKLSSYDAAYLERAMRLGLPLATLDQDLRKAAEAGRYRPSSVSGCIPWRRCSARLR